MATDWDWDDDEVATSSDPASANPALATPASEESTPLGRSLLAGFAIGATATILMVAIGFSLIAMPMFAFARADVGRGLAHPTVRTGLLYVALPVGLIVGIATGTVVSFWLMRGGRMPTDRTPFHEVE